MLVSSSGESELRLKEIPSVIEAVTGGSTAQSENILSALDGPKHAGLFEALADDGLAPCFDDARADEPAPFLEGAILHAVAVGFQIGQLLIGRFFARSMSG